MPKNKLTKENVYFALPPPLSALLGAFESVSHARRRKLGTSADFVQQFHCYLYNRYVSVSATGVVTHTAA